MSRLLNTLTTALCFASLAAAAECVVEPGAVLRVELAPATKMSPQTGAVLSGSIARPLYTGTCLALGAGTPVRATIGGVDRGGKGQALLGVLRLLAGGGAGRKPKVSLASVSVDVPGAPSLPIQAHFVRLETTRLRTASAIARPGNERRKVLLLEVEKPLSVPAAAELPPATSGGVAPAGSVIAVDILTPLHSAHSREGDVVRARMAEPLLVNGTTVLPAGTVLEGVLTQSRRARRPYRAGRMRLNFRSLRVGDGPAVEVALTPSAGEFEGATRLGPEGELTGGALNRKQALVNIGVAYLTGKILDDLIEEGAKAALGATVAGSAATAARYVALGTGTFLFLMHRGREVSVPVHTELQLTFIRPTGPLLQ